MIRGLQPNADHVVREALAHPQRESDFTETRGFVMRDALDEQIEAYEALLPEIKQQYGSVWALVANRALVKTFEKFSVAATYASEHYGKQQVLIRHTDQNEIESAPFVHVRVEG